MVPDAEIMRYMIMTSPSGGDIIVLVINDDARDKITSACATGTHVPSRRFGGVWRKRDPRRPLGGGLPPHLSSAAASRGPTTPTTSIAPSSRQRFPSRPPSPCFLMNSPVEHCTARPWTAEGRADRARAGQPTGWFVSGGSGHGVPVGRLSQQADHRLPVVLVDDFVPVRALVAEHLTRVGCTIVGEAGNGREATELVARVDCVLIVMDLH